MISLQSYMRRGQSALRQWALNPKVHGFARCAGYVLAGFLLSAASLGNVAMPLALGFVCACSGWGTILSTIGSCLGYQLFWGSLATQPIVWVLICAPITLLLAERKMTRQTPLLLPAVTSLIVSATGLVFQVSFGDTTPVLLYLLRTGLAGSCAWLFTRVLRERNPLLDWLACSLGVLALAQILPVSYFGWAT